MVFFTRAHTLEKITGIKCQPPTFYIHIEVDRWRLAFQGSMTCKWTLQDLFTSKPPFLLPTIITAENMARMSQHIKHICKLESNPGWAIWIAGACEQWDQFHLLLCAWGTKQVEVQRENDKADEQSRTWIRDVPTFWAVPGQSPVTSDPAGSLTAFLQWRKHMSLSCSISVLSWDR